MGKLRSEWQKWKKENPDFEKVRVYKLDVGPMMDDFEKWNDDIMSEIKSLEADLASWQQLGESLRAVYQDYGQVIKEQEKTDKGILEDYKVVWNLIKTFQMSDRLQRDFGQRSARV